MQDTAGEIRTNAWATFSDEPLHTDVQVLADQLELIYDSSVRRQDVVWKTCRKWCMIETYDGRESGKSVLAVRHDYDDDMRHIQMGFGDR